MKRVAFFALICLSAHAQVRSGREFQSNGLRAMENDAAQNPGMLWVDSGREMFARDCAQCHTQASSLAVKLPRAIESGLRAENADDAINRCRTTRLQWPALAPESQPLLSLSAFLHHAANGQRRAVEAPSSDAMKQGRQFWFARQGMQELACATCHDAAAGKRLHNQTISQGQIDGYPTYRLEWQTLGSVERRIRACLYGMEANVLPAGHPQLRSLELYLAARSASLPIASPAVRR